MKLKRPLWYYLLPLLSLGLLLAGWLYMAAAKPLLFPSPAETWQRLIKLMRIPILQSMKKIPAVHSISHGNSQYSIFLAHLLCKVAAHIGYKSYHCPSSYLYY